MLKAMLLALLVTGASEKPRLVVLDLTAAGDVDPKLAGALSEAITQEVAARGFFTVISSREIQTLLGLERQRQMMGCSDQSSCLVELAGAIGARFALSGTLARMGDAYQLTLQTLDSSKAQPLGRGIRIARTLDTLRGVLPYVVAEATGTPLPPPPSRLLPYSLIGGGALLVVGGGVVGMFALTTERAINQELERGLTSREVLKPLATYQEEARFAALEKTVALTSLLTGAALVAAGVLLNPPETPGGAPRLALVPTSSGLAVAGAF